MTFAIALALRLLNFPYAFDARGPVIAPVDELYHWKRIAFSAQHFPQVLEFDGDRGDGGAFCPWPPLYDLLAGGAARILGARDASGALARAVWFPPVVFALFVAAAVAVLARACGLFTAMTAGAALAASPFLVTSSWIGSIDHHFLEPVLVFAILGATVALHGCGVAQLRGASASGAAQPRNLATSKPLALAVSLICALFVQTALIIAAGLAFIVLFVRGERRAWVSFFAAAVAVALYRLTRAPGYPDSHWFLGWTHAALLAAAAVALAVPRRLLGLALGALVVAPVLPHLLGGAHFFGGDPWLSTIIEFQPVWKARGQDLLSIVVGLGAGAVLVWLLAWRRRNAAENTVAFFAIVYLLMTLANRRFWIVAIPLLALAGALYAGKRLVLALLVAVPPPLQLAGWLMTIGPPVTGDQYRWLQIAAELRAKPRGRVLAPWSLGHAIDVLGGQPVVIDNFGSMPDPKLFQDAEDALRGHDLERFRREHRVTYVVPR